MLTATVLSLTRSIALRVPLAAFKSTAPITLHRSPILSSLSPYRALSTSSPLFAPAKTTAKSGASKSPGRVKAKPKSAAKAKPKTKAKATPKVKGRSKSKAAAKPTPKVSTRVPLVLRPPKRPPTAFLLFYRRAFPSPGSLPGGITTVSKQAGEAWRKLTDQERTAFLDEAKILLADYVVQRDKWYKNPQNLQVLRKLNKDRKKRGKPRIHVPSTGSPRKPLPPFLRFARELRETKTVSPSDAPEGGSMTQLVWAAREAGTRWQALPASEKEKYSKAYVADLAKWKADNPTATV